MSGGVPGLGELLVRWHPEPDLAVVALAALAYLAAARHARPFPATRILAALGGLLALAAALASGLEAQADALLSAHMAQHLLLTVVAAPLLVAAAPVTLVLRALRGARRRRAAAALHSPVARGLAHPAFGLALFVAVTVGAHLPAVYEAALAHPTLHAAEHAAFLWSAIALWAPVIGADPLPGRPGAIGRLCVLLGAMLPMSAVGGVLSRGDELAYPSYAAPGTALGIAPLADQQVAGALMAVGSMAVLLPVTLLLVWRAMVQEERRMRAREAHLGLRGPIS